MPVLIRDEHLERMIDAERQVRGDATMAKTLGDIAREHLVRLQEERRQATVSGNQPITNNDARTGALPVG